MIRLHWLERMVLLMVVSALLPILLTYAARRAQQKLEPPLSRVRIVLFSGGLLLSVISALTIAVSSLQPFPLLADGRGGYSDGRNLALSSVALLAPLPVIPLATLGRGVARLLLLGNGCLLVLLGFAAFLSRGH